MDHTRRAERFLVDIIPHVDTFSRSLKGPGLERNIIFSPELSCAELFANGTYTLEESKSIILRADEGVFQVAKDVLVAETTELAAAHDVTVAPAYFKHDVRKLKYIPALEVTFGHDQHLLATIGSNYVQIYFRAQPKLPQKNVPWGDDMVGVYDLDGNCLKYPSRPPSGHAMNAKNPCYKGVFEHNGAPIFEFTVEKKTVPGPKNEAEYVLGAPLTLDRNLVAPISDKESIRRASHGLAGAHPPYHLATFLARIHE
jgi:hypothetical protein